MYTELALIAIIVLVCLVFIGFPRKLNASDREDLRKFGAIHVTPRKNLSSIVKMRNSSGEVSVKINPSKSRFANLFNLHLGRAAFFFKGYPKKPTKILNLAGRHVDSGNVYIKVESKHLPNFLRKRPFDRTIIVPHGYEGPAYLEYPDGDRDA